MRETTIGPWILFDFRDGAWNDQLGGYSGLSWAGVSCFLATSNGAGKQCAIKLAKKAKLKTDKRNAEELLERALLFYPEHQQSIRQLAKIYEDQGRNVLAAELRQKLEVLTVPKHPASARFGKTIEFVGLSIENESLSPGDMINLRYLWKYKPKRQIVRSYTAFVHFLHNGEIIFQGDHAFMAQFSEDELLNQNDQEIFTETLSHRIPTNAPAGEYEICIGILDNERDERLPARSQLQIKRNALRLPAKIRIQ